VRVTGVGGGHGLAVSLRAARLYADDIGAVVTVADDGGSSGRLTRELGIPPPGDIRNCLVALADESELARLYQHRFKSGALRGHTAGNLLIAALTEMSGDFASAVALAGELVGATGHVYPATNEVVSLRAQVQGGEVRGQVAVARTTSAIQAVYLEPASPTAHPEAVNAVCNSDQVILGPGSLYTSVIATLIVPGIRKALQTTKARRIFVCNSRMQEGETLGLDATAHVEAIYAHLGPYAVDTVVVQHPELDHDGVKVDRDALRFLGLEVVEGDVAGPDGTHDAERLGAVLASLQ
jgi:uncharacterized cofD-like protein